MKSGRSRQLTRCKPNSSLFRHIRPISSISNTPGVKRITISVNGGKTVSACLIAIPLTDQKIIDTTSAIVAIYWVLFFINECKSTTNFAHMQIFEEFKFSKSRDIYIVYIRCGRIRYCLDALPVRSRSEYYRKMKEKCVGACICQKK